MIIERSMNEQWLSNTYLVADELGSHAVLIDAGGPVEPLLEVLKRMRFQLTHMLLTHHHHDHVAELDQVLEAHPGTPVLIHDLERDMVASATGMLEPGQQIYCGALEIEPLHTPGHTAGHALAAGQRHRRVHGRHAVQGLGGRGPRPRPHHLRRSQVLDHGQASEAAAARPGSTPATPIRPPSPTSSSTTSSCGSGAGSIRRASEPCTALGEPATLILLGDDYDGGHKAWVRWPDGSDDIVPGSQVQRG